MISGDAGFREGQEREPAYAFVDRKLKGWSKVVDSIAARRRSGGPIRVVKTMADPVRVAVIGASGGMGQGRVEQFTDGPRSRVVAACARNLERLREAVANEAVRLTDDPSALLAAQYVDAVAVCTPNVLHYEQVKAALQLGKHVLCEYPLVDEVEQYDELVALAGDKGLVLHHSLTVRAASHRRAMKQALATLGEPRTAYYRHYGGARWYTDPALRGDMFCSLHIWFIDQLIDLFGHPSAMVAHGLERDGMVSADVMMQWASGPESVVRAGG